MEEQNIQEPEKVITGDTAKESLSRSIQGQNFKTDSRATNEQSKPFNPYSFLKEGRVPSANDMLEYHMLFLALHSVSQYFVVLLN